MGFDFDFHFAVGEQTMRSLKIRFHVSHHNVRRELAHARLKATLLLNRGNGIREPTDLYQTYVFVWFEFPLFQNTLQRQILKATRSDW
jgi:hypothetical protein